MCIILDNIWYIIERQCIGLILYVVASPLRVKAMATVADIFINTTTMPRKTLLKTLINVTLHYIYVMQHLCNVILINVTLHECFYLLSEVHSFISNAFICNVTCIKCFKYSHYK